MDQEMLPWLKLLMTWDEDIGMYWADTETLHDAKVGRLLDGMTFFYICEGCQQLAPVTNLRLPVARVCPFCGHGVFHFDTLFL